MIAKLRVLCRAPAQLPIIRPVPPGVNNSNLKKIGPGVCYYSRRTDERDKGSDAGRKRGETAALRCLANREHYPPGARARRARTQASQERTGRESEETRSLSLDPARHHRNYRRWNPGYRRGWRGASLQ